MATLNSTCPKCGKMVSEQDHKRTNVEPSIRQIGQAGPSGIPMQVHWQHKHCPR